MCERLQISDYTRYICKYFQIFVNVSLRLKPCVCLSSNISNYLIFPNIWYFQIFDISKYLIFSNNSYFQIFANLVNVGPCLQPCVCLSKQGECQDQPLIATPPTRNIFIIIFANFKMRMMDDGIIIDIYSLEFQKWHQRTDQKYDFRNYQRTDMGRC